MEKHYFIRCWGLWLEVKEPEFRACLQSINDGMDVPWDYKVKTGRYS